MQNDELKPKEEKKPTSNTSQSEAGGSALPKPAGEGGEELFREKKDVWERARRDFEAEERKELEKTKPPAEEEEAIQRQIRREIEMMELTPELRKEAAEKAKKIEFLGEKEKLERLMVIAKERGVEFVVKVAKDMNDPYVLDIFHDILIKEGFYKKFLKQQKQPQKGIFIWLALIFVSLLIASLFIFK